MMSMAHAASMMDGCLLGQDVPFTGVSTDSRTLSPGDLFFALAGEHFNGHEFIETARKRGASGAVVSEPVTDQLPRIRVRDTLDGLQRLAAGWRSRFTIPVVAITGSNGKTTVKELVAAVLRQSGRTVLATKGNLNNHIGVPLTLLEITAEHDIAVIEMGMNHAGEIALLSGLARPTVALVNNAMPAHIQALGSVEAVARAKGEIFQGLDADGIAILNADDPHYPMWRRLIGERTFIDFALESRAAVTAAKPVTRPGEDLVIRSPAGTFSCRPSLPGRHNAMNVLAAVAVCSSLGIAPDAMARGIEAVGPVAGRLETLYLPDGCTLLNDTYNANPGSMKAAIDVLCMQPGEPKILVAGDMGELGASADALHWRIGEYARECGVDSLIGLGPLMAGAVHAFGTGGHHADDLQSLLDVLRPQLGPRAVVLVKGSRSMRMERIVEMLEVRPERGAG